MIMTCGPAPDEPGRSFFGYVRRFGGQVTPAATIQRAEFGCSRLT